MYLQQLTLRNYRGFADLSVDFDRRLTVLVGENGTGKTAIIDAAAVMLGTFLAKFPDVSGPAIQRSDARRRHFDVGGVRDTQQQFPVTLGASGIITEPTPWDRVRADRGEVGRQNASSAPMQPVQPTQPTQWARQWSRSLRGLNGKMTSGEAHDLIELSDRYQSAVRADPTIVLPVIAYLRHGPAVAARPCPVEDPFRRLP